MREIGITTDTLTNYGDELTTKEDVRILHRLKAADTRNSNLDVAILIEACDLVRKVKAKAKTLSGGQKRKLQLAMTFAGGSEVCCVDEVSSVRTLRAISL